MGHDTGHVGETQCSLGEREQSVTSISSSQYDQPGRGCREETPGGSPQPGKKMKKKKAHLFGKLRKSTGKRGSTPTIIGRPVEE